MSLESYRPSNGTEGEMFRDVWCDRCKKESAYRDDPDENEGCPILSATLAFGEGERGYPPEWVWDPEQLKRDGYINFGPDGALCTAFEAEETP